MMNTDTQQHTDKQEEERGGAKHFAQDPTVVRQRQINGLSGPKP